MRLTEWRAVRLAGLLALSAVVAVGCGTPGKAGRSGAQAAGASATGAAGGSPAPASASATTEVAIMIAGETGSQQVACNGHSFKITATLSDITFRGSCGTVEIAGSRNTIIIPAAGALEISGTQNDVKAGTVKSITVTGVNNTVGYKNGSPTIHDSGAGNDVSHTF